MSLLSFPLPPDWVRSCLGLVPLRDDREGLFIRESVIVQKYGRGNNFGCDLYP